MIDKTSHYGYLTTYIDDKLVWINDPMGVDLVLNPTIEKCDHTLLRANKLANVSK
jgi:hypothetical protein